MTSNAEAGRQGGDRRRYQDEVESLLGEIRRRSDELRRLRAGGVRPAALGERKRDLSHARERLAELVRIERSRRPESRRWQLAPNR